MNENELILCDLLNCNRPDLYLNNLGPADLSPEKKRIFLSIKEKRMQGEPLQYILGKCEFFGLEFKARPGVLIPRPETEILVEEVIKLVSPQSTVHSPRILDIGTGSGNIAISLAKNIPNARITAIDISQDASDLAKENAALNGVRNMIEFKNEDVSMYLQRLTRDRDYDFIVSNPPYIKSADIENLQIEVRKEPRSALDGGADGLDFYRNLIRLSASFLKPKGILLFEIGFDQAQEISKIVKAFGHFETVEIIKDYNQIERIMVLSLRRDQMKPKVMERKRT